MAIHVQCIHWHGMIWRRNPWPFKQLQKSTPAQVIDLPTPSNHIIVDIKPQAGMQLPKHLNLAQDLNFIHIQIGLMSWCNKIAKIGTQESLTCYAHVVDLAFTIMGFRSTARTQFWQSSTHFWKTICDVHTSKNGQSFSMFATFSKQQTITFPFATKNPCHKMVNGHWQIWILETLDIGVEETGNVL